MALLDARGKTQVSAATQRYWSRVNTDTTGRVRVTGTLSKTDLADLITQIDMWLDTNKTSLLAALPAGPSGKVDATMLDEIIMSVSARRVDEAHLRSVLNEEVD